MLSSRLFWKLLVACAGLNLLASVIFGVILSKWQEKQLIEQVDRRLRDAALLVRGEWIDQLSAAERQALQVKIRQLGDSTGLRFTLITIDGQVLADSEQASLAGVEEMENHRDRPEVVQARNRGESSALRASATLAERFRYYAVRIDEAGEPVGIARAAMAAAPLRAQIAEVRRLVWGLVAAVCLAVFAVSWWIVAQIVQPVASLTNAAAAIAAGDYQHRVYVPNRDELGALGQTLGRISQQLGARMAELGESHERHATVLGGMIEGVIAVDSRQRIVLANKAAGRLFDFRPAAAEGRSLLEVVRDHALDQAVTTALAVGVPQRLEIGRDGSEKLRTDIHVTPLAGDPCPGAVLVMHDTTELRRLESLRRDFVANVSHELKTPLSTIKACAETLRNGALGDPEASQRFLGRIEEQSDRLHHLILDMLSLARIESGQQAFDIGAVDVAEVVSECVETHRPTAEAKQIELSVEAGSPSCKIRAEREGVCQILDNLLDNAIKYTPEGGKVTLRWRIEEGWAQIDVEDTGIGIGEDDSRRIFERFYRVDKARSRELGGTGLGLSIVKHLAQSFGGKVSLESEPGEGSRFTVELPAI